MAGRVLALWKVPEGRTGTEPRGSIGPVDAAAHWRRRNSPALIESVPLAGIVGGYRPASAVVLGRRSRDRCTDPLVSFQQFPAAPTCLTLLRGIGRSTLLFPADLIKVQGLLTTEGWRRPMLLSFC